MVLKKKKKLQQGKKKKTAPKKSKNSSFKWGLLAIGVVVAGWFAFWELSFNKKARPVLPVADGPNIVLIVVDTLRPDHMSLYGYHRPTTPHLERWFSPGTVYQRAYAPMSFTPPSMMSILSGLYPMNHGVRMVFQQLADKIVVLPEYLKSGGYHTAAVVSNMVLTDEATGIGSRFDYFDDFVDQPVPVRKGFERNAGSTTDAAIEWLDLVKNVEQPHFLWLHYMDPHGPYAPPEDKPITFDHDQPLPIDINRIPVYNRLDNRDDGLYYVDRYDEEIGYVDQEISRFLDTYKAQGYLDDAIVIFTSDHGEYMMDHEKWFTHGYNVYEASTRVPLMILEPEGTAQQIQKPVSVVDLLPTILEKVGLKIPQGLDGVSLSNPKNRDVHLEGLGDGRGKQFRALVRDYEKWVIYSEDGKEFPNQRRFYDLATDPNEVSPFSWQERGAAPQELLAALQMDPDPSGLPRNVQAGKRLKQAKAKPDGGLPMVVEGLDEETLERLRALGYVE